MHQTMMMNNERAERASQMLSAASTRAGGGAMWRGWLENESGNSALPRAHREIENSWGGIYTAYTATAFFYW